ncbi:TetR/AcrR family transcriptional regulator [Verticiella sediminum]|uniref:TetR/AcrR family transcriptional regulator n=1 Tax=Verticiella sediminum TaxID=1247510 RepID=A0A556AGW2_9BURK|nr:TetR/AcrR family transcriptional regulator [Verticiella sediminum]TSH92103.1 TetR/AcrR family transcriptional regulator [Verticiella sediminum]
MTQTTRTPSPRFQAKREAVLDAAAHLFNALGVKGATLSGIAASVGLITTSVTYYYRRKEQLAAACFLRTIETLDAAALAAASEPDLGSRVRAFFRLHADRMAQTARGQAPALVQLNDLRALPDPYFEEVSAAYTALFKRMRALLDAPDAPALPRIQLNARTHYVLSITHWMRNWADQFDVDEYDRLAERMTDIVLHGVAAHGQALPDFPYDPTGSSLVDTSDPMAEAFLRAASELVNEQGYRGASVDKISARLNVTKGAFYHHNDNKEDVVLRCFARTFSVIRGVVAQAHDIDTADGWARTAFALLTLARFQLSPAGPMLRLAATSALSDPKQRADVTANVRRVTQRVAGLIVDGMMDGSIRPTDALLAAQVATAAINHASELRDWVRSAEPDNVGELVVRPLLLGITAPASP